MAHDPYTDKDPEYANTELVSLIPPPNAAYSPRLNSNTRGRGRGKGTFDRERERDFSHDRKTAMQQTSQSNPNRITRPNYDATLFRQPVDQFSASKPKDFTFKNDIKLSGVNESDSASGVSLYEMDTYRYMKTLDDELRRQEPAKIRMVLPRADPIRRLGTLHFHSSESIQMANLDSALRILPTPKPADYNFLEVGPQPGRFSEYILWRYQGQVQGYGLPIGETKPPATFHEQCQVTKSYKMLDEAKDCIEASHALEKFTLSPDLIILDMNRGVETDPNYQAGTLGQLCIAFQVLKPQGSLLAKLAGTTSEFSYQILGLLNYMFDKISLTRPVSLGFLSNTQYVFCETLSVPVDSIRTSLYDILIQSPSPFPLRRFLNPRSSILTHDLSIFLKQSNQKVVLSRIDAIKSIQKFVTRPSTPINGPSTDAELQTFARWEWGLHQNTKPF